MTEHKHYVVCIRSDVEPGDVAIVGPFVDLEDAIYYGGAWQLGHGDNPCWQVVTLPDGFAPRVVTPMQLLEREHPGAPWPEASDG